MIKSLLFLGALAPSMLSGNVPSRSLDSQPTLQVGDVYRCDVELEFILDGGSDSFSLFNDDDLGFNSLLIKSNTFYISCSDIDFDYSINVPYNVSFDYSEIYVQQGFQNDNHGIQSYTIIAVDNASDTEFAFLLYCNLFGFNSMSFTYSFEFEIVAVGNDLAFSNEALEYLTKVEAPYTPPAKSNLYRLIYDFYYSLFNDEDLSAITTNVNLPFDSWLCHTLTIITLLTFVFILFLLLRWLFKLVGNLTMLRN